MMTLHAAFSSILTKNAKSGPPDWLRRLDDEDFDPETFFRGDTPLVNASDRDGRVLDALPSMLAGAARGGQLGALGGGIGGASLAGYLVHRALKRRAEEEEDAELSAASTMGPLARGTLVGGSALGGGMLGAGLGFSAGVPIGVAYL